MSKKRTSKPAVTMPNSVAMPLPPLSEAPKNHSNARSTSKQPYLSYAEKLRDPRWQRMRLRIMERDQFKCRHCRSADKTLNVHHSFYTKGAAPWEYEEASLLTLCEDCHGMVESRNRLILAATASSSYRQVRVLNYLDAMNGSGPYANRNIVWLSDAFHSMLTSWEAMQCAKNQDGDLSDAVEALRASALNALENIADILKAAPSATANDPFRDPELLA